MRYVSLSSTPILPTTFTLPLSLSIAYSSSILINLSITLFLLISLKIIICGLKVSISSFPTISLLLLLLLVFKHNTKIYVQEDGNEYVLGGKERLSKNNKAIDVDKFLDGNTYPNRVKIVLNKKIAEKLDKQKIEIKHRGKVTKKVIKYNNEEFEIVLKELKLKEWKRTKDKNE